MAMAMGYGHGDIHVCMYMKNEKAASFFCLPSFLFLCVSPFLSLIAMAALSFSLASLASSTKSLTSPSSSATTNGRASFFFAKRAMVSRASASSSSSTGPSAKVQRSEQEWRAILSPEQFRILRQKGTEYPGTGKYNKVYDEGIYECAGCGTPLYKSITKFDSGCGWPAFYEGLPGAINETVFNKYQVQGCDIGYLEPLFQKSWQFTCFLSFIKGKVAYSRSPWCESLVHESSMAGLGLCFTIPNGRAWLVLHLRRNRCIEYCRVHS